MAGRTIQVSGIPYIPDEQLLVDFLEDVLGNGCVRACRLVRSSSHESSSSNCCKTEGDSTVRAIVETESAESASALHNLAKARLLVFWCATLAVKFVSCPDPDRLFPPDPNSHDVPSDPEICVYEQNSPVEDLPLEADVEQKSPIEDLLSEPDVEQKSSMGDLPLEADVIVSEVAPDVNISEPKQLSEPRVSVPEVVDEPKPDPGPKSHVPEIFRPLSVFRPKIPELKVACQPEILSSLPKDLSDQRSEKDEKLGAL